MPSMVYGIDGHSNETKNVGGHFSRWAVNCAKHWLISHHSSTLHYISNIWKWRCLQYLRIHIYWTLCATWHGIYWSIDLHITRNFVKKFICKSKNYIETFAHRNFLPGNFSVFEINNGKQWISVCIFFCFFS